MIDNPHIRAMLEEIDKELAAPSEGIEEITAKPGPKYPNVASPFPKSKTVTNVHVRKRQAEELKRVRAEHAAELSRPLIDANLVSDAERDEIYNRVKGSTHWRGIMFSGSAG